MDDAHTTVPDTRTYRLPTAPTGSPVQGPPGRDPTLVPDAAAAETERLVELGWEEIADLRGVEPDRPVAAVHRRHRHPVGVDTPAAGSSPHTVRAALAERLPAGLRGGRLALSRGAVAALVLVALLTCLTAGAFVWRARPHTVELGTAAASVGTEDTAWTLVSPQSGSRRTTAVDDPEPPSEDRPGPSAASLPTQLVVDVEGRVTHPGVERLPEGARVVDAVAAAGGALPGTDTSAINLARLLADGDEIIVGPSGGVLGGAVRNGATPTAGAEGPVDLNTATTEQLETLPGVGPSLAQRIIDWRAQQGPFTDVSQLRRVKGIGSGVRYAEIAKRVRV